MNLKFIFGRYDATRKEEWNLENNKVNNVLECLEDNPYYSESIEFACDERTLAVNEILEDNTEKCIGCIRVIPSFRTEVIIDIILHPSIRQISNEKGKEYYIAIHNKLENVLREIGITEMKDWILDSDDYLHDIYKELGYEYLDGSVNGLGEPTVLLSKILK